MDELLQSLNARLPTLARFLVQEPPWSPIPGVSWARYIGCFAAIFGTFVLRGLVARSISRQILGLAKKTQTDLDDRMIDVLRRPLGNLLFLAGAYAAVRLLQPTAVAGSLATAFEVLGNGLYLAILVILGLLVLRLVDALSIFLEAKAAATATRLDDQLVPLLRKTIKVFAILVLAVVFLQNLGYSVGGLLASLGIGGLAVALAAQDTLANLFGSVTIFADRPFQIGDRVRTGDVVGSVEQVGFRTTRIRTDDNILVSIPNSEVASGRIQNESARRQRRLEFTLGLTYETSADRMKRFVEALRAMLRDHEALAASRAHFRAFGASSLEIQVVAYTRAPDFVPYLDTIQDLNLRILDLCAEVGVEMAFDSRAIYFRANDDSMVPTVRVI